MAEYEERSLEDLTEEPSAHRIEELRKQGQVVQSRELSGTIALLGVLLAIYFLSGNFISQISELMKDIFTKELLVQPDLSTGYAAYTTVITKCLRVLVLTFFPIALSGLFLGVATSMLQTGFLYTTETLNPDFKRIDPIAGFFKVFSMQSLVEGLKSILKFSLIAGALYYAIKGQLESLPSIVSLSAQQIMAFIGSTTVRVFAVVGFLLLAASGVDYWTNWRRFRKQAMMTKAEAKQELKEREGDPQIKARIRTIQRDAARKRMMKSVPKADVVVTNPTHFAIAISYDPENGFAPRVVAKGADYLAERIKKIAREHGVPTVENKPLARTLYKHVKVGQMIPRSLYQAVAEILAYVYRLKGRKTAPGMQQNT